MAIEPKKPEFTVARNGTTLGGYNEQEIRLALAKGDLKPDDHCWADGFKGWQTLKETFGEVTGPKANNIGKLVLTHSLAFLIGIGTWALLARPNNHGTIGDTKMQSGESPVLIGESSDYQRGWIDGAKSMNEDWIKADKQNEGLRGRAEAGDPKSMLNFGICLLEGKNGVEKDVQRGIDFLHKAAASGLKDACGILHSHFSSQQPQDGPRNRETWAQEFKYMALAGFWPSEESIAIWKAHGNWDEEVAQEGLRRAKEWATANGQTVPVSPK